MRSPNHHEEYQDFNNDFFENFFAIMAGAGCGALLGFSMKPLLSPIISAILSNIPVIPHLVFLPTFTGSLIVTCGALAGGYLAYSLFTSDGYDGEKNHSPAAHTETPMAHNPHYLQSSTRRDAFVAHHDTNPALGIPVDTPNGYHTAPASAWNPHQAAAAATRPAYAAQKHVHFDRDLSSESSSSSTSDWATPDVEKYADHRTVPTPKPASTWSPHQATAVASHSAVASRVSPDFGNSGNFTPQTTVATPSMSASSQKMTPSFS